MYKDSDADVDIMMLLHKGMESLGLTFRPLEAFDENVLIDLKDLENILLEMGMSPSKRQVNIFIAS